MELCKGLRYGTIKVSENKQTIENYIFAWEESLK